MEPWKEKIISIFNSKVDLSPEEQKHLLEPWREKPALKRNDFLIRKDQVETSLFYIISGSLRIFYPAKAEEICVGFAYDHNLICSYPSFIRQQPSAYISRHCRRAKQRPSPGRTFIHFSITFPG